MEPEGRPDALPGAQGGGGGGRGGGRGGGGGGRKRSAAAEEEEEQEERRRQLQAFLAAKGKLGQRRGGGAAAAAKPSWKDRPPRQSPAPSRADPAAKGQKNGVRAKPRKALSTKDQDKLPTGQVPPTGCSRAKAAPSLHPGKGPQLRGSGPPNQHPLGQATKPARREVATGPPGTGSRGGQLCFGNHRAKREGEKENQRVTAAPPPPEKKRAISWGSLRGPSQATSKEPREKDHRAAGHVPHTSTQVPLGRPAEELARGRPRDWPAISQRAPVARPSLRFGRAPGVCRPAADSRGPRAAKPLGSAPVPVKGGPLAGVDHLAPLALQGRPRQQQVKGGPAVLADGRPHGHRLAPQRLPKASSAARGGIGQKRSPGRSEKSGPRAPRTPRARPGPPAADHPAAVLTGAPTGCGRRLLHSNTRRPRGPQSPSPQDRRKLLEEWLASRGKIYKRPPMVLLAKRSPEEKASLNLSFWHRMEEEEEGEEEEVHAQRSLASDISSTLAECLKLAEEGALPEQLLASISRIPEVEKFAQFWICKARCLAQGGPFDAAGLYEAALRSGAAPLRELQDAMADILKDSNQTPHAAPTQARTQARLLPGETQVDSSPQGRKQGPAGKPASAVKIQVVPLFRANERGAKLDMQLLTPVRRSLRIEEAAAGYPPMLKEHRLVVSSLDEIPASDLESHFLFRNNLALPEGVGLTGLRAGLPPLGQNHLLGTPHLLPS